jgi:DNA-binding response OmpR family regulator
MNGNHRKRVLIVDKDEQLLIGLERLLEDVDVDTVTTWSAEEALGFMRSSRFDALLAGDHLADMSCEEFLREVQRAGIGVPVLVLESVASRTPSIASYFVSLGATAAIRKWSFGEIAERVKAISVGERHAAKAA